jgi:hypothetical protein
VSSSSCLDRVTLVAVADCCHLCLDQGVVLFFLIGGLIPFVKGRLPDPPRSSEARREPTTNQQKIDYGFVKKRVFWIFWMVSTLRQACAMSKWRLMCL